MPSVVSLLLPLGGAVVIGVIAAWFRLFGQDEARVLSRFVFTVAMPITVFTFAIGAEPPTLAYAGMVAAYLAGLAVTLGLAFVLARLVYGYSVQESGSLVFPVTCGNAVFMGLPIAIGVPGWAAPFVVLMVFEGSLAYGASTALMTWPEERGAGSLLPTVGAAFRRAIGNPIVLAMISGTALMLLGVELPGALTGALDLFAPIASPVGLFVLGLYLVILPRQSGGFPAKLLVSLLPLKLVFFPALSMGLCWWWTKDATLTAVVGLFTTMPPAVSSIILASAFHLREREVATLVAVGTLAGIVTVTLFLVLALG